MKCHKFIKGRVRKNATKNEQAFDKFLFNDGFFGLFGTIDGFYIRKIS